MNYDNSIYIYWSNSGNSTDTFEFRMVNDYMINLFSFYGGVSSVNQNAMYLTKNIS
jgi:predicted Zn-dependent protease